jgi:MoaA/NifB/PqqE/SkfB family radical SAM enzyme
MNSKCIEYQMFTKCNLKCPYCYNYFDQTVGALQTHITNLDKLSVLADRKTCFVINGGEPFLLKGLATLVNSVKVDTNIITYTNGTLPKKIYEKFIKEVNKDKLFLTISVHYAELLRTGNVNDNFKENVKLLVQNIPNVKVNIVFTEDFLGKKFTEDFTELLKEFKSYGLKYINILLQDELKHEPVKAIKLVSTEHFKEFFEELDMFQYKHCMWNNRDTSVSCLQMWLRKEVMDPGKGFKTLSVLRHKDIFEIEHNFDIQSEHLIDHKTSNLDGLIADVKPLLG